eukprot:CAMPEP_0203949780 /NCGR_PEP_ID=MMETSP0359-20131031/84100_1 /ASSEMBLY_ACC=CAM_ASM_000338 /TAXON_ID=268821 /ORGANISM="Scrippsiella Hangoei, Strain SHTV-5" /LENGTH=454 /DNA_ID=CAMNT_0050881811 /DNA_START=38 /DNA_END=1402 /DNA_ORIENTATION=+
MESALLSLGAGLAPQLQAIVDEQLKARSTALDRREQELDVRERLLEQREQALAATTAALLAHALVPAPADGSEAAAAPKTAVPAKTVAKTWPPPARPDSPSEEAEAPAANSSAPASSGLFAAATDVAADKPTAAASKTLFAAPAPVKPSGCLFGVPVTAKATQQVASAALQKPSSGLFCAAAEANSDEDEAVKTAEDIKPSAAGDVFGAVAKAKAVESSTAAHRKAISGSLFGDAETKSVEDGAPAKAGGGLFGAAAVEQIASSTTAPPPSASSSAQKAGDGLFGVTETKATGSSLFGAQNEAAPRKWVGVFGAPAELKTGEVPSPPVVDSVNDGDSASGAPVLVERKASGGLFSSVREGKAEITTDSPGTTASLKDMFEQKTKDANAGSWDGKVSWKGRQNVVELPAGGQATFPAHDQPFKKGSTVTVVGGAPPKQRRSLEELLKTDETKQRG